MVPTGATALATLWQATLGVASGSASAAVQFSASYGALLGIYSTSGSSAGSFSTFVTGLTAFIFDQGPYRGAGLSQTERLSLIMAPNANLRADGTTTTNGGVFVRRTPDEILLGYVAADPFTSITGKGYNGMHHFCVR